MWQPTPPASTINCGMVMVMQRGPCLVLICSQLWCWPPPGHHSVLACCLLQSSPTSLTRWIRLFFSGSAALGLGVEDAAGLAFPSFGKGAAAAELHTGRVHRTRPSLLGTTVGRDCCSAARRLMACTEAIVMGCVPLVGRAERVKAGERLCRLCRLYGLPQKPSRKKAAISSSSSSGINKYDEEGPDCVHFRGEAGGHGCSYWVLGEW